MNARRDTMSDESGRHATENENGGERFPFTRKRTFSGSPRPPAKAALIAALVFLPAAAARAMEPTATTAMTSPLSGLMESFVIFLREGTEAVLLIAALWAALAGMAAPRRAFRALLGGAGAGLALSALAGITLASSLAATGELAEMIEGLTLVLAAVVLLFVSSWLLGRREAARWKNRLREKARESFATGGLLALAAAGFLAVFREGAETVLFILAAFAGNGGQAGGVIAGGVLAALVLAAAFLAVKTLGLRLPLATFFTVSAWALLALAVIYAGRGVHALQEAGLVTETVIGMAPRAGALGLYPYTETLLAQAAALLAGILLNMRVQLHAAANADPAE